MKAPSIMFNVDKKHLLTIARDALNYYFHKGQKLKISEASEKSQEKVSGAFVTLKKDQKLKGCIGRFNVNEPIERLISNLVISSATEDHRFEPVKEEELNQLEIEISLLTPLQKIEKTSEIIPGKHGIYIKKGIQSGTFLPQVAEENNWNTEEMLGYCAKHKAMIGWDGWKDAEIFIYEAVVFSERDFIW